MPLNDFKKNPWRTDSTLNNWPVPQIFQNLESEISAVYVRKNFAQASFQCLLTLVSRRHGHMWFLRVSVIK